MLGDDVSAAEATAVRDRVEHDEFVVACVGQSKRGKSTLLNALVGDPVLPAGITPVTAVPTVIRFGNARSARIQESQSGWRTIDVSDVADYVSEERNPGNVRSVTAVEVVEPSALLANGLCLVDTPGVGSVFDANTQATLAFVPQIDVALVVIGTDPPVGADELRLIEGACRQAEHVLIVLNKADRAEPSERQEACQFARWVIEARVGRVVEKVFEVSAKEQLNGLNRWPDWDLLLAALERLAAVAGSAVSLNSGHRALARIRGSLCREIARTEHALTAPIEASTERLTRLHALLTEAERKLEDLAPVLEAQERRLKTDFGETARTFRAEITAKAHNELRQRVTNNDHVFGPRLRRAAFADAQDVARETVANWLPRARQRADELFNQSMQRFADSALSTWRAVKDSGVADLGELPDVDEIVASVAVKSRFRFNEQITIAQPASPLRYGADVILGVVGLSRFIVADAHRFLDWLLALNVGRVESDLIERVREGRTALEHSLRSMLVATRGRAEAWREHAKRIRDTGAAAVESELARLENLKREVENAGQR
jgi:predicted GTPase